MIVTRIVKDGVAVEQIKIARATYKEADELKDELGKDLSEKFFKVVIDLSECKYLDSAFLGVLVTALKEFKKNNGDIKIAAAHSDAEVLLDLTRMNRVFDLYKTVDEAINSYHN